MRCMVRRLAWLMLVALPLGAQQPPSEQEFRARMGFEPALRVSYRALDCGVVDFDRFAQGMAEEGAHADVDRSIDGREATLTVRQRGRPRCDSPYPPIATMPPFALKDLAGKTWSDARLRGKPTLLSFFYATCLPCIREVEPLNELAAARPGMNFLSVTFDEPDVARAFVERFGVRWRVVADARDFIDRVRVKSYPTVALFAADGRLLGFRKGGARDELEAANVRPQLERWMEGLLRADASRSPASH